MASAVDGQPVDGWPMDRGGWEDETAKHGHLMRHGSALPRSPNPPCPSRLPFIYTLYPVLPLQLQLQYLVKPLYGSIRGSSLTPLIQVLPLAPPLCYMHLRHHVHHHHPLFPLQTPPPILLLASLLCPRGLAPSIVSIHVLQTRCLAANANALSGRRRDLAIRYLVQACGSPLSGPRRIDCYMVNTNTACLGPLETALPTIYTAALSSVSTYCAVCTSGEAYPCPCVALPLGIASWDFDLRTYLFVHT
ncbi:hypothetical protein G7046_g4705 [Stylonectria norvegica]|nr:hypothetical protein G7046_g4705 [Stylonectria norvegica]